MLLNKITNVESCTLKKGIHTFLNPFSYIKLRSRVDIIEDFDFIHVDGFSLVVLYNILFKKNIKRYSFDMTSVAPTLFELAIKEELSLCIIGSDKESVGKFQKVILSSYPDLKISFLRNGYFASEDEKRSVQEYVIDSGFDIVIVGMGAVLQDEFLVSLKLMGFKGYGYTCGGFIHQTALGKIDYYPKFINKFNLRWLYRIFSEPKLAGRYFYDYPKAILQILIDFYRYKK